jgi:hypothetical protein
MLRTLTMLLVLAIFPSPARGEPPVLFRRLALDLTGRLPDPALVTRAAAADLDAFVDRALAAPDFHTHWARVLRGWLTARKQIFQPLVNRALDRWLAAHLARGNGLDVIARQLVTAAGSPLDDPALSYLLQFRDTPELLAGHVARTFHGSEIQCAQCHDHPFEKWKKEDFAGFTALFSEMKVVQWPRALLERELASGRVTPAEYMSYMPAYVRSGFAPGTPAERRVQETLERYRSVRGRHAADPAHIAGLFNVEEQLAYLAVPEASRRASTPRTLPVVLDRPAEPADPRARFLDGSAPAAGVPRREALARWLTKDPAFARWFVKRIYIQLVGREPAEPLDALAAELARGGYRLEPVVRAIVKGDAYKRAAPRPLAPEVLVDVLYPKAPQDLRATLEDELVAGFSAQGSLALSAQDLLLWFNGRVVETRAREPGGPADDAAWVEWAFAHLIARAPTGRERDAALAAIRAGGQDARADVVWALATSVEFLVNR